MDRLVVVADDHQVARRQQRFVGSGAVRIRRAAAEQPHEAHLRGVGVLKLVDQQVREQVASAPSEDVRPSLEEGARVQQQVGKVHHVPPGARVPIRCVGRRRHGRERPRASAAVVRLGIGQDLWVVRLEAAVPPRVDHAHDDRGRRRVADPCLALCGRRRRRRRMRVRRSEGVVQRLREAGVHKRLRLRRLQDGEPPTQSASPRGDVGAFDGRELAQQPDAQRVKGAHVAEIAFVL